MASDISECGPGKRRRKAVVTKAFRENLNILEKQAEEEQSSKRIEAIVQELKQSPGKLTKVECFLRNDCEKALDEFPRGIRIVAVCTHFAVSTGCV
eukprot:1485384-Prorocentrum_lima.AAC.1